MVLWCGWGWTHDSKFKPWRSEAEHATSRSRRLPTILSFTSGWGGNIFCFFQTEPGKRTPNSSVKGSVTNHYHRAPALMQVQGATFFRLYHVGHTTLHHNGNDLPWCRTMRHTRVIMRSLLAMLIVRSSLDQLQLWFVVQSSLDQLSLWFVVQSSLYQLVQCFLFFC